MPFEACQVTQVLKPLLFEALNSSSLYVYVDELFDLRSDTKLMDQLLSLDSSILGMYFQSKMQISRLNFSFNYKV